MAVAPTLRLTVWLESWRHGYQSDFDDEVGTRRVTRYINATGSSASGLGCTVIGCKYPPALFSPMPITVSFNIGMELPIGSDVLHLAPRLIHTDTSIKSHSGWLSLWTNPDAQRSELTADLYIPPDAFVDIYDRLKVGTMLPRQLQIDAAGATLQDEPGTSKWNVSGPKYLFIVGFSLYFPTIETPQDI